MRGVKGTLPGIFWRAWFVVLTARAAQFVEAFLPLLLLVSLHASPTAVATVLVAQQLAATLGFALVGRVVRATGLVGSVRVGLLVSALAVAVLATAGSVGVALLAAAVYGFGAATWRGGIQALVPLTLSDPGVADHEEDATVRSRAFGAIFWAANAGAIASAAAGAAGVPLRALLGVQAGLTVAALVVSWLLPPADAVAAAASAPASQQPSTLDLRRSRRATWLLTLAFTPATMLMFQAFGGLAVALPADDYRVMVLGNAVLLVLAQPLLTPLLARVGPLWVVLGGVAAMTLGMAVQPSAPGNLGWTALWTVGELVLVVVPGALVSAAVPVYDAARHVGRFQVVQGASAAVGLLLGPAVAGQGPAAFAWWCAGLGLVGTILLVASRGLVATAWAQPVSCPCGALFCVCGRTDAGCASPSPVLTHHATTA